MEGRREKASSYQCMFVCFSVSVMLVFEAMAIPVLILMSVQVTA